MGTNKAINQHLTKSTIEAIELFKRTEGECRRAFDAAEYVELRNGSRLNKTEQAEFFKNLLKHFSDIGVKSKCCEMMKTAFDGGDNFKCWVLFNSNFDGFVEEGIIKDNDQSCILDYPVTTIYDNEGNITSMALRIDIFLIYISFYQNGQVSCKSSNKPGKIIGERVMYNEDGTIGSIKFYEGFDEEQKILSGQNTRVEMPELLKHIDAKTNGGRENSPKEYPQLMLDLETMGDGSDSAIVSIAAVEFNIETGEMGKRFYEKIDLQSCIDLGLSVSASTILWWMRQGDEARKEINGERVSHIKYVMKRFSQFCTSEYEIWANPPKFDCAILQTAYLKAGLPVPWIHRNERCVRTLASLKPHIKSECVFEGTAHNALHDCYHQIRYTCATWLALK